MSATENLDPPMPGRLPTSVVEAGMVIGLLAYGIDRLLFFFQRGLFPYRVIDE